jgi:hypothetical protein
MSAAARAQIMSINVTRQADITEVEAPLVVVGHYRACPRRAVGAIDLKLNH